MLEVETGNNLQVNKQFIVLPNPNKGIFETNFDLEKGKKATLIISGVQERTLYRQAITGQGFHKERINLAGKALGMLIIQLHPGKEIQSKKINIAR